MGQEGANLEGGQAGNLDPKEVTERLAEDPEFQRALDQAKKGESEELKAALESEESFISWLTGRFPWAQSLVNEIIPIAPALMQALQTLFR